MKKKKERKVNQRGTSTSSTADWSALPMELVSLISQFIDNEIDLIRFRSICSNWRSSSIPNHHRQISPIKFPLVHDSEDYHSSEKEIIDSLNNTNSTFYYLSKRTLVLVKPPQHGKTLIRRRPWLIRVTQNSHGKTKFFDPFISCRGLRQEQTPIPPPVLDFNKLSILYLGTDYIIDENKPPRTVLAVMCHGKNRLLLGRLSPFRPMMIFGGLDEQWKLISKRSYENGDICLFKGRFYAVDRSGETITVGPNSSIELAAQPLGPGRNKMLVESEGRLLLLAIDKISFCFSIDFFELDEKEKKWVRLMDFDEKEKKWVKLRNFGDRIFFIGRGCSFSASASDLCIPKGNCVVFIDESVLGIGDMFRRKRVFHLDQNQLSCGAKYLNLFLPPTWIHNI